MDVVVDHRLDRRHLVRSHTGEHFKENDARTVKIGARIDWGTFSLLWTEVRRCPHDLPACRFQLTIIQSLRNAEVSQRELAICSKHQVWVEIAMNDAMGGYCCDGMDNLLKPPNCQLFG